MNIKKKKSYLESQRPVWAAAAAAAAAAKLLQCGLQPW